MRHLKIFEDYNRQNYYHFTSKEFLLSILNDNSIKAMNTSGVSLTRDKNLYKHSDLPSNIRIELDSSIGNNYKIQPHQDCSIISTVDDWQNFSSPSDYSRTTYWKGNPNRCTYSIESEERTKGSIKNIIRYINLITIFIHNKEDIDYDCIDKIKSLNIPYEIKYY